MAYMQISQVEHAKAHVRLAKRIHAHKLTRSQRFWAWVDRTGVQLESNTKYIVIAAVVFVAVFLIAMYAFSAGYVALFG